MVGLSRGWRHLLARGGLRRRLVSGMVCFNRCICVDTCSGLENNFHDAVKLTHQASQLNWSFVVLHMSVSVRLSPGSLRVVDLWERSDGSQPSEPKRGGKAPMDEDAEKLKHRLDRRHARMEFNAEARATLVNEVGGMAAEAREKLAGASRSVDEGLSPRS